MALDALTGAPTASTVTFAIGLPAAADTLELEQTRLGGFGPVPMPTLPERTNLTARSPLAEGLQPPAPEKLATTEASTAVDDWRSHFDAQRTVRALERVTRQSSPDFLDRAINAYARFLSEHPHALRNPYYYVVDYGLSNLTARGYVLDMQRASVVEGPFMVAHGSGSLANADGAPRSFANVDGTKKSSLGLYTAGALYPFVGHADGKKYRALGLRLDGQSGRFNDQAGKRGVVAHGAPYVTSARAGRSAGCPALEMERAERLLPLLANGGAVFLYSPRDTDWLANDPWSGDVD